ILNYPQEWQTSTEKRDCDINRHAGPIPLSVTWPAKLGKPETPVNRAPIGRKNGLRQGNAVWRIKSDNGEWWQRLPIWKPAECDSLVGFNHSIGCWLPPNSE